MAVSAESGKGRSICIVFYAGRQYARDKVKHLAAFMAGMIGELLPARQIHVRAAQRRSNDLEAADSAARDRAPG